jgi:hypothetical protein
MNWGSVVSGEGVTLVMRAVAAACLIMVGAFAHALVKPGRTRGRTMLAGTVGGMASGVVLASPMSQWLSADTSVVCACVGMVIGGGVSWSFAKQVPREAN